MRILRPLCIVMTLLLAGCAGSSPSSAESDSSGFWSDLLTFRWFTSAPEVTESGPGDITAETSMQDKEVINKGLNRRYTLLKGMRSEQGRMMTFWQGRIKGQTQLMIQGDKTVQRIEITDPGVKTEGGVHTGVLFSEIYDKAFGNCQKSSGPEIKTIACQAPDSQHISYLFSGEWHGPEALIPPDDVLEKWTLTKIIWQR